MLFGTDGVLFPRGMPERAPGAAEAMAALRHRGDIVLSVVADEPAAAVRDRVTAAGLDRYLDFTVGAYGSDTTDADRLVQLARDRATAAYGKLTTVVVVATATEIVRARPAADVVIAATGSGDTSGVVLDELLEAGADHLVTDLRDVVALGTAYAG